MANIGVLFIMFIVILVVIGMAIYINKSIKIKKYLQQINELERKRTVIYGNSITHEFNKLKRMNISKESELQVSELEKTTAEVFKGRISELSDILYDLEDQVVERDLSGVAEKIQEIEIEIETLNLKTQELSQAVKAIVSTEETAAIMHADLKDKVYADLKLINNYKNKLGPDLYARFHKRWEELDELLKEYIHLNIVEDRERADEIVTLVNLVTKETQNFLYYIPVTKEFIRDTLQPKLDKIVSETTRLTESNFILRQKDLKMLLDEIQILINGIEKDLEEFKAKDFHEEFEVTIQFLNQVEREIFDEIKAHFEFPKKLHKIDEYSKEIKVEFDKFAKEKSTMVKRGVDQTSVTTMEELSKRFDNMQVTTKQLHKELETPTMPYSDLVLSSKAQLREIANFREDVYKQTKILASKIKKEQDIKDMLERQREMLNRTIVALEAVRLKTVPDWYYIKRDAILGEFDKIDAKLEIGEFAINELIADLTSIKEKVERLYAEVSYLIDSYELAKSTIIYLNRFLNKKGALEAKARGVKAFENGDYKLTADIITKYLEVIEV